MENSVVVENEMKADGMWQVHVMGDAPVLDPQPEFWQAGDPIWAATKWGERWQEHWLASVPWESSAACEVRQYLETGAAHLKLRYPARGMVMTLTERKGIIWRVMPGERLSEAVMAAAWRYMANFDVWPGVVSVGDGLHEHAGKKIKLDEGEERTIMAEVWVPRLCVFVWDEE